MKFILVVVCKMPTTVGILKSMRRMNETVRNLEQKCSKNVAFSNLLQEKIKSSAILNKKYVSFACILIFRKKFFLNIKIQANKNFLPKYQNSRK